MLSLQTYTQQAVYDGRYTAVTLEPQAVLQFNLVLEQPCVIALTMNFCSMMIRNEYTNNPFSITVNGHALLTNYSPHNINFMIEQWIVPPHWLLAGNNSITVSLSASAETSLDIKRFGAAGLVLTPQTGVIHLVHENGRLLLSWPEMPNADRYAVELYKGADRTTPVFADEGILSLLGIVLPGLAEEGSYAARVRPSSYTVQGAWTDFVVIKLSRSIFFLSTRGQQSPSLARLALEARGIVVYGNGDALHLEGLAADEQIAAAPRTGFVSVAYGGRALTAAEIVALPASQRVKATDWNYYYSAEYAAARVDTTKGLSWGDPGIGAPPVVQWVTPQRLRQGLGLQGEPVAFHLHQARHAELRTRLTNHFADPSTADRLFLAATTLPDDERERVFQPGAGLQAMFDADPKVAMRGSFALALVTVRSTTTIPGAVPANWKVTSDVAAGATAIAVTGGTNDLLPDDQIRIGTTAYTVVDWKSLTLTVDVTPATTAPITANTAISIVNAPRVGPRPTAAAQRIMRQKAMDAIQWLQTSAPQFRPNNWSVAVAAAAGGRAITIGGGLPFPKVGDSFTLPGSGPFFAVASADPAAMLITTTADLPALARGDRLTFPDTLNFKILPQAIDIDIDVAYDYAHTGNNSVDYWVLPAVGKLTVGTQNFAATWDGLEAFRTAFAAAQGCAGAGVLFMSDFPSDWFAFAMPTRQLVFMSPWLSGFAQAQTTAVIGQVDARDQDHIRSWLNQGTSGTYTIPANQSLAITVEQAGKRWTIKTVACDPAAPNNLYD